MPRTTGPGLRGRAHRAHLPRVARKVGSRSLSTLRPGGTLVSIVPPDESFPADRARAAGMRAVFTLVEPDQAALRAIASLVDSGRLRVEVGAVAPLEEVSRAHALGEGGRTRGKIVLSPT
ncbi:zinc-binding dehydrogenase [Streptomyces sp. NPDC001552]|uniref:zinc-binding dehydrogenase n=1 Tax=Streptomyces sp. NPDC001552 TaxID=3364587 RepID=UPI00368B76DF